MSYESGEPAANSVMMSGQPWLENLSYFTERTDNWCGSPSGGFPPSMPAASMPATYMPAGVLGRLPHAFTRSPTVSRSNVLQADARQLLPRLGHDAELGAHSPPRVPFF